QAVRIIAINYDELTIAYESIEECISVEQWLYFQDLFPQWFHLFVLTSIATTMQHYYSLPYHPHHRDLHASNIWFTINPIKKLEELELLCNSELEQTNVLQTSKFEQTNVLQTSKLEQTNVLQTSKLEQTNVLQTSKLE